MIHGITLERDAACSFVAAGYVVASWNLERGVGVWSAVLMGMLCIPTSVGTESQDGRTLDSGWWMTLSRRQSRRGMGGHEIRWKRHPVLVCDSVFRSCTTIISLIIG